VVRLLDLSYLEDVLAADEGEHREDVVGQATLLKDPERVDDLRPDEPAI
jgi:hypothetical protein